MHESSLPSGRVHAASVIGAGAVLLYVTACRSWSSAVGISSTHHLAPSLLRGRKLILGSSSKPRKAVLSEMRIPFEVRVCSIDERAVGDRSPTADAGALVLAVAKAKATALLEQFEVDRAAEQSEGDALLLTCDQVVCSGGRIMEKPVDAAQARDFLRAKGRPTQDSTVGALVLTDVASGRQLSGIEICSIFFDPLSEEVIDKLVAEGNVMDCAGALMSEHPLIERNIRGIRGSKDGVLGLSKRLLVDLLTALQ